jgi:ATP-dependent Clp protease ATP-binding subunit ClpC
VGRNDRYRAAVPKWLSTDAARALEAAELEARLRRQAVGTPHLLLGLLADQAGRPVTVLTNMGFSVRQVQYEAARKLGRQSSKPARRRPARSARVEDILGRARHEATAQGRRTVESEDILLALVAEPEGKAAAILARLRPPAQGDPGMVSAAL